VIEPILQGQLGHRLDEVLPQRAADAPVGELDQFLLGPVEVTLAGDECGIDVDLAHVVDDDGHSAALAVGQDVVEQGGLPGAEEAGQHRDGQQHDTP
jgi:hypothetical protein